MAPGNLGHNMFLTWTKKIITELSLAEALVDLNFFIHVTLGNDKNTGPIISLKTYAA